MVETNHVYHTGAVFGRWTVVGESKMVGKHRAIPCRCECGTEKTVLASNLLRGLSKSCGCLRDEIIRRSDNKYTTHGLSRHPLYRTWKMMWHRCHDRSAINYDRYGARGITCYWKDAASFIKYVEDTLGERPTPGHTIDRKDNALGYAPGNLQWATDKEQALNRRSNRIVEMWGESLPVQVWCDRLGLKRHVVKDRVRDGWDIREAILTPVNYGRRKRVTYDPDRRLV